MPSWPVPRCPGGQGTSMRTTERNPVSVSVAAEVETLRSVLEAARILGEQIEGGGLENPENETAARRGVLAILALVESRLEILAMALRSPAQLAALRAPHNRPIPGAEDVVLRGPKRPRP